MFSCGWPFDVQCIVKNSLLIYFSGMKIKFFSFEKLLNREVALQQLIEEYGDIIGRDLNRRPRQFAPLKS